MLLNQHIRHPYEDQATVEQLNEGVRRQRGMT